MKSRPLPGRLFLLANKHLSLTTLRSVAYIAFFCISLRLFSQPNEKLNPRITLRGYAGIPRAVSSKMFRTAFNGLVESGLSANVRLKGSFFTGVGYQYTRFLNNKELFVYYRSQHGSLSYKTYLHSHAAYFKLGYDRFFSNIGYISYSVNTGIHYASYNNIVPADSLPANQPLALTKFNAPYVQPEIAFNFLAEKLVSFSLMMSYTTMFYRFEPRAPRFNHIEEVRSANNGPLMSWINIGFGFNILLGK